MARRSFEPVARPGDDRRYPTIWDGLDPADVAAFRAEASHRTARLRSRPAVTAQGVLVERA